MTYEELLLKLETYGSTHPNVTSLWKHYIQIKRESYHKSIQECKDCMDLFLIQPDINKETILFLYMLCKMNMIT